MDYNRLYSCSIKAFHHENNINTKCSDGIAISAKVFKNNPGGEQNICIYV